ncbi:hypothetical protein F4818DRAFT_179391 [Hypoxylon cercidicola]|nr:hypothetical protein F4818DRAFT_179391 [Hypoxylon cercidicola]
MPAFFIPARNSRHRTACFALYRALLQQAPRIRLPDDLAAAWGPVSPIKHLIRRAFRRNRNDTSPRLIFPALKAGYQMLDLLRSAAVHSSSSPWAPKPSADHTSVVSFLRARLDERNRSLEAKKLHPPHSRNPPKPTSAPRPGAVPLLVNVTPAPTPQNPDPKPVYATPSRPRPQSELGGTGRRKVPHLDMASDFPFLRTAKPQSPMLSRVLTQKIRKRVERTHSVKYLFEDLTPDAELEDDWEQAMAPLLQAQGRGYSMRVFRNEVRAGNTFRQTVWEHGIMYVQTALTRERDDQVARADAMRRLIEQEAALAEKERALRRVERRKGWEAKMLELHGEKWRELFPNLKDGGVSTI